MRGLLGCVVTALALLGPLGCGETHELVVDLRTDFVAGLEVAAVEMELRAGEPSGALVAEESRPVFGGTDIFDGFRVLEASGLETGTYVILTTLRDGDGAPVATQNTRVEVRGTTGVTVVITRDCTGVMCPAAGDVEATACIGARCVDPSCTPETPEHCPPDPACSETVPCAAAPAACAEAQCVSGTCFLAPRPDACMPDEACHPETGCEPLPGATDAGVPDAAPDGGVVSPCEEAEGATTATEIGAGSADDPYVLCNASQLVSLGSGGGPLGASYALGADIDVSAVDPFVPIGNGTFTDTGSYNLSAPFTGAFDGRGYTITGLRVDRTGADQPAGLFGATDGATIDHLRLRDVQVRGSANAGGLVGVTLATNIRRVAVSGTVRAGIGEGTGCHPAGGLVGASLGETAIQQAWSDATVESEGAGVGGIVGFVQSTEISDALFAGTVTSGLRGSAARTYCTLAANHAVLGGIGGALAMTSVRRTIVTGRVDAPAGGRVIGGILGYLGPYIDPPGDGVGEGNLSLAMITLGDGSTQAGSIYGELGRANDDTSVFDPAVTGVDVACGLVRPEDATDCDVTRSPAGTLAAGDFHGASHPVFATWDFTSVWRSSPDALPALRFLETL